MLKVDDIASTLPELLQSSHLEILFGQFFWLLTALIRMHSGASLGYQLASGIAGGPAPLIATGLFASCHSGYASSIYVAACAVVSLVATAIMPDYTGRDISMEHDD